ncbi:MAG: glycerol-3-phosphate dehydrogenase/oxidase [Myxococcales bacterium]|nr:glycerol-3-phosphate dehydrogenase/oxidase [Myxococcales bacterium]
MSLTVGDKGMERDVMVESVFGANSTWDMVIVGGGATGIGMVLDAASRGYRVCLVEQADFGKGTSSRSTKLIHGGVRYLQQGNLSLVREALRERGRLRQNAPHLVTDREFIVPTYSWWESPYYGLGLRLYDYLSGIYGFGASRWLSAGEVLRRIPGLETSGLRGGISYFDGQFDDARLIINMVQTAVEQGAVLVNYCSCVGLLKNQKGQLRGIAVKDGETGREGEILARVVVNATGCFVDSIRQLDDAEQAPLIAPSQGIHLVLDGGFLAGNTAMMVPRTSDGRVLFAIPWHGRTVVGTTDTPISSVELEPSPQEAEVAFVLDTAKNYLSSAPQREDVLSVFTGIRPLVRKGADVRTSVLSRDHTLMTDPSGLVTMTGGKWTTYRHMAEVGVDHAIRIGQLEARPCLTQWLNIRGHHSHSERFGRWWFYGSDAVAIEALCRASPLLAEPVHPLLPVIGAQVKWAVTQEMARTVEDVLARRTRALLLNAQAAVEAAPTVAQLMAGILGHEPSWVNRQVNDFVAVARGYQLTEVREMSATA